MPDIHSCRWATADPCSMLVHLLSMCWEVVQQMQKIHSLVKCSPLLIFSLFLSHVVYVFISLRPYVNTMPLSFRKITVYSCSANFIWLIYVCNGLCYIFKTHKEKMLREHHSWKSQDEKKLGNVRNKALPMWLNVHKKGAESLLYMFICL